ncbi:MAG: hypothetical protein JJ926_06895 [Roseitalea sp.]|jgi:hypothetical protein|uniref:Uncharacterized protein n=1 Tax=Effrenium voratum TaxID=2562239 RepID=A0AA36IR56_9DINO|nr:hypothetical protein [Oceaniradius stylonematis]MBO6552031.1 hypothetical protein [Roseitalea sp.]MBO6951589.1 hypothetical protein [Rhizobiaceae bacterium]CAJ1391324.1 unnamed protein product [Effrenium voratum]MBO6592565.1 hypothetical protein [Roseitalea sp.]MBO6598820.1 hypothetical protein [Roseitalea sp.]
MTWSHSVPNSAFDNGTGFVDSMRIAHRQKRLIATWFSMFAVLMLFLAGGTFAHADAVKTPASDCYSSSKSPSVHAAGAHETSGCKSSTPSQSLHCGAHILLAPAVADLSDTTADHTPIDWPVKALTGRSNALDPPPPRYPSSLI